MDILDGQKIEVQLSSLDDLEIHVGKDMENKPCISKIHKKCSQVHPL